MMDESGIVDRFEHHKNLIWCVAEEYQEGLSVSRVKKLAAEIRQADDHDHASTPQSDLADCETGKEVAQKGLKVNASNQSWPTPNGIGSETALHIREN